MRHGRRILPVSSSVADPNLQPWSDVPRSPGVDPRTYTEREKVQDVLAGESRPIPWQAAAAFRTSDLTIGTEFTIIGAGAFDGPVVIPPVPQGYRAVLSAFEPLAFDAFSNRVSFLGEGTGVIWKGYVDKRILPNFEVVTLLGLGIDNTESQDSIAEFVQGQVLTVTVTLVSNGMGLQSVGARVRGRWVPLRNAHDDQRASAFLVR